MAMKHGGDIYGPEKIRLDFSVNISPAGIPEEVFPALERSKDALTQYPDPDCRALRRAISDFAGVPARKILCGNGASELLLSAVEAIAPRTVLLSAPCFSGYERAARAAGAQVLRHYTRREEDFALTDRFLADLDRRPDMVILCSPGNPVGSRIPPALMHRIAAQCAAQGTWLMADECFLDLTQAPEDHTMRRFLDAEGIGRRLLVLDAFTKKFAMPGIRLGYLMAGDEEILEKIALHQPEWSVSVPAQTAGCAALENAGDYLEKARIMTAAGRRQMEKALTEMGCTVYPGDANYLFFSAPAEVAAPLLREGILIRDCSGYPGLRQGDYRAAVRRSEENEVLLKQLKAILARKGEGRDGT